MTVFLTVCAYGRGLSDYVFPIALAPFDYGAESHVPE